jgi:membrane protease YdiL (CAAX protease family)
MGGSKRQMRLYLISALGVCWALGIAAAFSRGHAIYQILQKGFTAFPVIATVLTRRITKDKTQWRISLKVWKDKRLWAFCAFVPGILIAAGAALYFLLFPEQYSGNFRLGGLTGTEQVLQIANPLQFGLICILIAAVCIPVQLLELGEEIGWREYLLPKQVSMYGVRKGIVLNSLFWGAAHLPLICLGFNYSPENVGAPWSNMLMMMLVCMTTGVICSWVMVRSGNVLYSAIVHGVVNVIGEIPVFLSISGESGLLGPNPTGLVSMSGLILCAAALFIWLPGVKSGEAEMADFRPVQK